MGEQPTAKPPRGIDRTRLLEWGCVLREQHGVISSRQLAEFGVTIKTTRSNVRAERWRRLLRGVYATFTGPPTRQARLLAALLYAGQPAVLSHQTAAEEWGVVPIAQDEPVHVTVPYNCSALSCPPDVVLHRSRAFWHIAVDNGMLPRTRLVDTLVDLAVTEATGEEAGRRFLALATSAQVPIALIEERLCNRKPWRYRKFLDQAVSLIKGGAQSVLEAEYELAVENAHGLPAARRQTPVVVDGRVLWEDATYDDIGVPLTVRLDGRAYHSTPGVAFRDRRRDNAAELAGRSRLVYGWHEVRSDPCGIATEVATVLRRYDWADPVKQCPRCPLPPR